MRINVTVELEADTVGEAEQVMRILGYTVTKATAVRQPKVAAVTARVGRANALTEMPDGLDGLDGLDGMGRAAYVRGYAKGCSAYARKHPAPTARFGGEATDDHNGTGYRLRDKPPSAGVEDLRVRTVAHGWDRQPTAHRAGLLALKKWSSPWPINATQPVSLAS